MRIVNVVTLLVAVATSQLKALPDGLPTVSDLYDPGTNDNIKDINLLPRQPHTALNRTWPGMPGFPDYTAWRKLGERLDDGQDALVSAFHESYAKLGLMHNIRVIKEPYMIVVVKTVPDVKEAMRFARRYNILVAIQSSGHSFIGRSTCDGCMQINMRAMNQAKINLQSARNPAGEITVEPGVTWLEVYNLINNIKTPVNGTSVGRVVVGGSAHTVAMGGYTQGGGHSPITRMHGLAVDNLLEATLVTVDGRILTVSADGTSALELDGSTTTSNDTSLFWAIRGGGGGTWGAVVSFTFRLHYAPQRFRNIKANWILKKGLDDSFGRATLRHVLREVNKLSPNWGGYIGISGTAIENTDLAGVLSLFLNHHGSDSDASNAEISSAFNYNVSGNQYEREEITYPTFIGYENTAIDPEYTTSYIINTFVQPETITDNQKLDQLIDIFMNMSQTNIGCTGTMIGGAASQVSSDVTPVNADFRSGLMSLSCGLGWDNNKVHDPSAQIDTARRTGLELRKIMSGVYFNECDEDLSDWKTSFWETMDKYCKLKKIKKQVDPDNFLWCHNCVGSDLATDDCP